MPTQGLGFHRSLVISIKIFLPQNHDTPEKLLKETMNTNDPS